MCSGAARTFARIAGSLSHSANAAPSARTFGPKSHIQPNPRGRRATSATASPDAAPSPRAATGRARTGASSRSPASIRRISAESDRSLDRIQP
jgi:hypothetical protein